MTVRLDTIVLSLSRAIHGFFPELESIGIHRGVANRHFVRSLKFFQNDVRRKSQWTESDFLTKSRRMASTERKELNTSFS